MDGFITERKLLITDKANVDFLFPNLALINVAVTSCTVCSVDAAGKCPR